MIDPLFRGASIFLMSGLLLITGCGKTGGPHNSADVQRANDTLRGVIKKTIHDPAREAQLEQLATEAGRQAVEMSSTSRRMVKDVAALNRHYDAGPADIHELAVRFKEERKAKYQILIDTLIKMRSLTDKKEWKPIAMAVKKALLVQLTAKEGG